MHRLCSHTHTEKALFNFGLCTRILMTNFKTMLMSSAFHENMMLKENPLPGSVLFIEQSFLLAVSFSKRLSKQPSVWEYLKTRLMPSKSEAAAKHMSTRVYTIWDRKVRFSLVLVVCNKLHGYKTV